MTSFGESTLLFCPIRLTTPFKHHTARCLPSSFLKKFVGTYTFEEDGARQTCRILLENESLMVDGMLQVWPRTRLISLADRTFAVESLPFLILFEADADDVIVRMRVTGPELLFGTVAHLFVREQE